LLPIRGERHAKLHMVAGVSSSNGKVLEVCRWRALQKCRAGVRKSTGGDRKTI